VGASQILKHSSYNMAGRIIPQLGAIDWIPFAAEHAGSGRGMDTFRAARLMRDLLYSAANRETKSDGSTRRKFVMLGGALVFVLAVLVVFVL
jgi:hypothetical protein